MNETLPAKPTGTKSQTVSGKKQPVVFSEGLQEYSGSWSTPQVVHLLKRTLFGAKLQDVAYFKNKTMQAAVDELLQPAPTLSTYPLNNYSVNGYTDPTGVAPWQTWINTGITLADKELNEKRIESFKTWWLGQVLNSDRSIHEKLVVFWHNHFATDTSISSDKIKARFWYDHYLTLRQHALGNFKSLAKAITLDPAMLYFLNGDSNVKGSPNENYARELQELYTVGKGPNSGYTEDDVKAAALVLTGHTVSPTTFTYFFDAGKHDPSNKEFSSFYGNKIITGYSGPNGASEIDELLDMIFSQEELSKHICRKIYRYFVYYKIDSDIEQTIISPLAEVFRNNNFDIQPVLSVLFRSKHFYDMVYSSACIIKSPLDFVIGHCHEFNVALPSPADNAATYAVWQSIRFEAGEMQQELGSIPQVAGWYAYYQEPAFYELWVNTATYIRRNIFTDRMIADGITSDNQTIVVDALAFADQLANPGDPNLLIDQSLEILFRYPLSQSAKEFIKRSILLSGQLQDYYWTNAWDAYKANPTDPGTRAIVSTRLRSFYKYIMNLPEYHLC
ncbi:MAG: DUF1800 domain-containing protein [Chitinophagaceae bacterium]|nr:DUF1800 domain-containing protein [Chitinophagaceae bacterium]